MAKDMLRERLAKFIPPKEEWTPVDEALYGVEDIYNVPDDKAKKLREDAIRYSFKHHYENNRFYHNYCKNAGVGPDDIKTEEDFGKIPLVPDTFFKSYPDIEEDRGKGFLQWLENIYTGELPKIELKKKKPSYDDVIEELAKKNICMTYSTGTSGKFSFTPRDWVTYSRTELAGAFMIKFFCQYTDMSTMAPFPPKDCGIAVTVPNPLKLNLFMGKIFEGIIKDLYSDSKITYLVDRTITIELFKVMLGRTKGIKSSMIRGMMSFSQKKLMSGLIKQLEKWEEEKKKVMVVGTPIIIDQLMSRMEKEGVRFHFEDGLSGYGGGWKTLTGEIVSPKEFREKIKEYFGIPEENCRDIYGMSEGIMLNTDCEFHYKHIPYFSQPYILDEEMNPLPYGEYGTFAFLDPLANSYPGFIITGDKVKLLEHCPECDRPGPVLAPEISRMEGTEPKGCAEVMEKALEEMRG
jgi:phenylacetate-coenzyme A ligase PaaK-like adenylate-forming protein